MQKNLLFVCIFNVKRSVVAQHMLQKLLAVKKVDYNAEITIRSAGFIGQEVSQWFKDNTIPYPDPLFGRSPSKLIQDIMAARGFDLFHHRSQPVNEELLNQSDLIIPLLTPLKRDLVRAYPETEKKVVLPGELIEGNVSFLWEDTTAVPNDDRMFDFAHSNRAYVTNVINEIDDFLQKSFHQILQRLF